MRIMIIDDDPTTLLVTEQRLVRLGHEVQTRSESMGSIHAIRKYAPDVLLLDMGMPALSGFRLAELLQAEKLDTKIVLFSAAPRAKLEGLAMSLGAAGVVHKEEASELGARLEVIVRSHK